MKPRSSAVPAGMFVAALAAFVLVQTAATSSKNADTPRAPQGVRVVDGGAAPQAAAWTRVLVELKLPSRHVPEGSLKNLTAVLAQRQVIAARRERLLARLPAGTFQLVHAYLTIPYVALDVTTTGAAILADSATDVERVMPDSLERPSLVDSAPLVEADQAWAIGYDGTGISIGVVDTGVDATHPFLAGKVQDEACYSSTIPGVSETLCPNHHDEQVGPGAAAPCPSDDCVHGTHVAGIAAGDGTRAGQSFSGIAKGADILAVQVFSKIVDPALCGGTAPCVRAFSSDVLAALEHLYIASWDHTLAAVNVSLGSAATAAACDTQPYKSIVDNLRAVGVATVVAAGNGGSSAAVASPACVSSAVSVGSTSKSDRLSSFSNVAPGLSLLAPGEAITSSLPGGAYGALTGTSMAAAHVAGAFAIAKQAAPNASVSTILDAFRQTGLPIVDTRVPAGVTVPRLRIYEALTKLTHVVNSAPTIASISPSQARAGDPAFSLTVDGSGFDAYSVAQWNGSARPTTVVSASRLAVAIAASDVAAVGTASVRVATPAPGGGTSSPVTFTIAPPATLTASATRVAPDAGVTVTLANGFGGASDWLALASTDAPDANYLQQTLVGGGVTNRTWTVTMPTTPGTYEFRLFVNNVRKATSAPVTVDRALTPAPVASSMSPSTVVAGASAFTLVVQGSHFVPWSVVQWNGASRPTTYVSATELHAAINDADVANAGTVPVSVLSPAPGGGTSGSLTFTVTNPSPAVTSLAPTTATAGSASFVLTVNGSGFVSTSTVRWNGTPRATTFVNATTLQAAVSAADVQAAGAADVTVDSPAPGGGTSNAVAFAIVNPVPSVVSLSPASVTAGAGAFTLTVNGSGFVSGSTVMWNGVARATTFVSSAQLQVTVSGADVATARTAPVTVVTPPPGGGTSNAVAFAVVNPVPSVASLSPASVTAGAGAFTLTVNGSGFVGGSTVMWNGVARATTFVSSAQLQVTVSGADVATAGTAPVTVVTPPPGGGTSNAVAFAVVNPVPSVASLSPSSVTAGAAAFTLTVNGSGFVSGSTVMWNGVARATTFVSSAQLQVTVSAADVATAGTAQVTVVTPAPGGGTSNAAAFAVVNPVPSVASLSPANVITGAAAFTLTVNGSGFVSGSTVMWNGVARATTFVSSAQLQVTVSAADVATAGTAQVAVVTPAPGGGTSGAATFTTVNPAPSVSALSPVGATAGGGALTLTVNGTGFVAASTVYWNGAARPTTFVNGTQLQAAIASADLATPGTAQVSVASPAPGGGTSASVAFPIAAPPPALSVSATTVTGGSNVTVTLTNGLGGSSDWIALAESSAPNTSYVTYTYVGAGVTTRTWTVAMPATGGPYEFRLFLNNGYTRAATSPQVTVVPPVPTVTTLTPTAVVAGSSSVSLIVNGSGFTSSSVVKWNGANRTTTYFGPTQLSAAIPASDLITAGSAQVTVFTPAPGGGTSNAVTFTISAPPSLSVSSTTVTAGALLTVTLTNGLGGSSDWLAFAPTSAPDTSYLQWVYVGAGVTTRTWTINAPVTAGTYEFRLFLNNGYTRAATSPTVTVKP